MPILALVYAICPYDLFPDFFVGFGWIDDLIILFFLWWYFYNSYKKRRHGYEGYYGSARRASGGVKGERTQEDQSTGRGNDFREKDTPRSPHLVLGIEQNASKEEIKKAYRRLASRYHPDKVNHLGEEFRDLAKRRFRDIQEAYQMLMAE